MNVSIYEKGMIFIIPDKNTENNNGDHREHPYIIIGDGSSNNRLGYIQAMGITSMRNKSISTEVPIMMNNGKVSYIVPYNIHSFKVDDIRLSGYKGCITDTSYITKKKFLAMLMKLYIASIGAVETDVTVELDKYKKAFWDAHSDVKEFRRCSKNEKGVKIVDKPFKNAPLLFNNDNQINKKEIIQKAIEKSTTAKIQQEEHVKEVHIKPVVKEDEADEEYYIRNGVNINDMKVFNTINKQLVKWTDNELIKFYVAFKSFGYKRMHEVIPDKWVVYTSMYNKCTQVKKELETRGYDLDKMILKKYKIERTTD